MADQTYILSQRTAQRLAQVIREVEGLKRSFRRKRGTRGVIPPMQVVRGIVTVAVPKGGSGTVTTWALNQYATPTFATSAATTLTLSPVFAWGINDGMQWPEGAEVWLAYSYGDVSGWHVFDGYPCPEAIPGS